MEVQIWTIEKLIFYLCNPRQMTRRRTGWWLALSRTPSMQMSPSIFESPRGQKAVLEGGGRRLDQIAGARHQEVSHAAA